MSHQVLFEKQLIIDESIDTNTITEATAISSLECQVLNTLWGSVVTEFSIDKRGLTVIKQVTWSEVAHDDMFHSDTLDFQYFEGFQRKETSKNLFQEDYAESNIFKRTELGCHALVQQNFHFSQERHELQ